MLVRLLRLLFLVLLLFLPGLFPVRGWWVRRSCLCVLLRGLFLVGVWWRSSRRLLLLVRLLLVLLGFFLLVLSPAVRLLWWFVGVVLGGVRLFLFRWLGVLFLLLLVLSSLLLSLGADLFVVGGPSPFFCAIATYLLALRQTQGGSGFPFQIPKPSS